MKANEAVILFKNDCFTKKAWKRTAQRYKDRSIQTLVRYISENYDVTGIHRSEIESELRSEFEKALKVKLKNE